jgi:hypothetical protein
MLFILCIFFCRNLLTAEGAIPMTLAICFLLEDESVGRTRVGVKKKGMFCPILAYLEAIGTHASSQSREWVNAWVTSHLM